MINLKVGDKVTSTKYPDRVFNLAWYKNGDNTCAIEDGHLRAVVKVSTLDLVTQEQFRIFTTLNKCYGKEGKRNTKQNL